MTKPVACLLAMALLVAGPVPALAAPMSGPAAAVPAPAATVPAPAATVPAPAAPLLPHVSSGDPAPAPAVAGLLSALAPIGVAGAAGLVYGAGFHDEKPMMVLALAPLALGAGQAYAGDPWRGLAVGVGGYVAGAAGLAGGLLFVARRPSSMTEGEAINVGLIGAGAVMVGYYAWSVADAAGTAARARQAHAERLGLQAARVAE